MKCGVWIGAVGAIYLVWGFGILFGMDRDLVAYAPLFFVTALTLPFIFPPFGRWLNLDIEWDKIMLSWFNKKDYVEPEGNKLPNSEPKEKSEKKTTGQSMYSVGLTDENRVSFRMGYTEITMNPQGVQNLIDQLELFKKQIMDVGQPAPEQENNK